MSEIRITQYNKLIVNYDTYEFSPSNHSNIVFENPWYIDTSSAPDFIKTNCENNNIKNININDDVYTYEPNQFIIYKDGTSTININQQIIGNHSEIINTINKTYCKNYASISYSSYYANLNFPTETYTSNATNITTSEQILFPVTFEYNYISNQSIPLVKTITITINSNNFHMHLNDDIITISRNGTSTVNIINNDYTYENYRNILLNNLNYSDGDRKYIYMYNHYKYIRFTSPTTNISGKEFDKLYGIFHCFKNFDKVHNIIMPANNRCLYVPEGTWNIDDFIHDVNSNSSDVLFNLTSTNKYIYINCDMPFIINPICKIITEDTDISDNYNKQHILLKHPMNQHFIASCKYNNITYSEENDYTPAEFLRWIYNVTGVKCILNNDNTIICQDPNLIVADNPFFKFKENGIVENICEMKAVNYNVFIRNTLTSYNIYYTKSNKHLFKSVTDDSLLKIENNDLIAVENIPERTTLFVNGVYKVVESVVNTKINYYFTNKISYTFTCQQDYDYVEIKGMIYVSDGITDKQTIEINEYPFSFYNTINISLLIPIPVDNQIIIKVPNNNFRSFFHIAEYKVNDYC